MGSDVALDLEAKLDVPLVALEVGAVESEGSRGDVLEQDGGVFEGEGDVELGTDSHLGDPVLDQVDVLHHEEGLLKGVSLVVVEVDDSLHKKGVT